MTKQEQPSIQSQQRAYLMGSHPVNMQESTTVPTDWTAEQEAEEGFQDSQGCRDGVYVGEQGD